ncbi:MAG: phosphoenolpyruvate carboxykinase (ATP) [Acidimicrobiia bacterium]|nr:phosphoenolpyruvate carboxykinase (ATP) [Acidimicrobiia bacterium]
MDSRGINPGNFDLRDLDLADASIALWNLGAAQLVEAALTRGEGQLASNGAFVVRTGKFTGRSPKDKFIVRDPSSESTVHWGPVNQAISGDQFDRLLARVQTYFRGMELFVQDLNGGADSAYTLPVRVVSELAWHNLFGRQLLLRPSAEALATHKPQFHLLFAPGCNADPAQDGTNSSTAIAISFTRRMVLILGTFYAGELKKSVFTILNYLLPDRGVFPMHCSANVGQGGDVALFFGLSGTGKTTLSADPVRGLIGDDEHGWSDHGVFNFEGGCYAKCIRLSRENEPQIWDAIRFGSVLENVLLDENTRVPDYDSDELTENSRAGYPIEHISNAVIPGVAGHPRNVVFLTADAFGVLPPISRLTPEMAMYHFLSGYTAKLAGTERGLGKEPVPNFSACFGAPFLPRHPEVYAKMLGDRLRKHSANCWLVNTGWVGGAFGTGSRMKLPYTRAMVNAAIEGRLDDIETCPHPVFQVLVPRSCPGVPAHLLDARGQWKDTAAYDKASSNLSAQFRDNFQKFGSISPDITSAGPRP